MDNSTLIDNVIFWSIFLPVFWLVWKSHPPLSFFHAQVFVLKRNWSPIFAMKRHQARKK